LIRVGLLSEFRGAERKLSRLGAQGPRLVRESVHDGIRAARTYADRRIRSELNLRKDYVMGKLPVKFASDSDLTGLIRSERRGLLLSRFDARQLKGRKGSRGGGVSVRVHKSQGRIKLRHAFFFPLKHGGEGTGQYGLAERRDGSKRSFKALYGPSGSQAFGKILPDAAAEAVKVASQRLIGKLQRFAR